MTKPLYESFLGHPIRLFRSQTNTLKSTSTTETASAPHTLLEFLNDDNLGCIDSFDHKLCNTVSLIDLEVLLGVVEQQNLDLPSVIRIYDPCACVDKVLDCETRPWCYPSICDATDL